MDTTTTKITDETIAALCAQCDSASLSASASLQMLAKQTGPRNRAKWRREHILRLGMLDRAAHNLLVALFVQPHAVDNLTPSMRQHATHIHGYAVRSLNNFRA